ncbi:DNA-binding XRE family transcriptional regulator [Fusobacterium naviforme]|nr:DNA-binding XRE family transcriptional regulator [Fusobacterium naviforme]STO27640.1 transcriptional repressor DicA [Fusobacterium naviforme]
MSTFSARLISLRKERELSQEALGKIIQKKRSTVSGYESEGKEPDIETLCLLAKYFGVSTDYLLGYSDKRLNVDTVFFSDSVRFQKHYEALSPELRPVVAKCFDAYYRLLNRDVQLSRPERLLVYQELFGELSRLRAEISRAIELSGGSISEPVALSELMALQSELKNSVSALLDKLMQADIEVAFNVSTSGKGEAVSAG